MKSSGTFACSANVMKLFQESGRRERITSPVAGSRRMKTSLPSKRYSEGRRTAWLLPFLNNFAVRAILSSSTSVVYTIVYHSDSFRRLALALEHSSGPKPGVDSQGYKKQGPHSAYMLQAP